jgi:hypothetical protein
MSDWNVYGALLFFEYQADGAPVNLKGITRNS